MAVPAAGYGAAMACQMTMHDAGAVVAALDARLEEWAAGSGVDFQAEMAAGRRPGIRRLAQAAGMSERAVWRAFHERTSFSEADADRLLCAAGLDLSALEAPGAGRPWLLHSDGMLTVSDSWEYW